MSSLSTLWVIEQFKNPGVQDAMETNVEIKSPYFKKNKETPFPVDGFDPNTPLLLLD